MATKDSNPPQPVISPFHVLTLQVNGRHIGTLMNADRHDRIDIVTTDDLSLLVQRGEPAPDPTPPPILDGHHLLATIRLVGTGGTS